VGRHRIDSITTLLTSTGRLAATSSCSGVDEPHCDLHLKPSLRFVHTPSMSKWPKALFLLSLLTACAPLRAQQSYAIAHDPAPDAQAPTQNLETVMDSRGSHIMACCSSLQADKRMEPSFSFTALPVTSRTWIWPRPYAGTDGTCWPCTTVAPGARRASSASQIVWRMSAPCSPM
jgi:hypothetical protein